MREIFTEGVVLYMRKDEQSLKSEVRKSCLAQRATLGEEERKYKSRIIQQRLEDLPEFQKAQVVMLFLNFRDEVDTTALAQKTLDLNKKLILPRCAPKGILLPIEVKDLCEDIEPGVWGIREPKLNKGETDPSEIDLIVVPGAGFDLRGDRLGYGGGFYDRFFMRLNSLTPRVALCFECQVIDEVPVDKHDVKMTMLITENDVYNF
jgi:5,10-methenyltetrahydrofolate synthetase